MKPVRVGVIGVGAWGKNHARVFQTTPEADLAGVCDADPARAREAAERFGCAVYPDPAALLADTEAVTVAAPTTEHHSLTLQAIRAGVHVLVEKPIARTVEEAEEMDRAAGEAGLVLAVGHLERFNPAVEALLAADHDPRFLEIHRLSPFDVRGLDVSVVLDLMIHDIDILLRLVRSPVSALDAVGVPVLSPAIDIANARIRFENGSVANLTASRISLQKTRKIRIFERDRYTSLSYTDQTVTVYRKVGEIPPPDRLTPDSFANLVRREQPAVEKGEPLRNELVNFLRAVRGDGKARRVTAREGTEALVLALRVLDSMDGDRDRVG